MTTGSIKYIGKPPSRSEVKTRLHVVTMQEAGTGSTITLAEPYGVAHREVFLNGILLEESDFTANDAQTITFASDVTVVEGDLITIHSYDFSTVPRQHPVLRTTHTASQGQTDFIQAIEPIDSINVYVNGILLPKTSYSLNFTTNTITLSTPSTLADKVEVIRYVTTKLDTGGSDYVTVTTFNNEMVQKASQGDMNVVETQINNTILPAVDHLNTNVYTKTEVDALIGNLASAGSQTQFIEPKVPSTNWSKKVGWFDEQLNYVVQKTNDGYSGSGFREHSVGNSLATGTYLKGPNGIRATLIGSDFLALNLHYVCFDGNANDSVSSSAFDTGIHGGWTLTNTNVIDEAIQSQELWTQPAGDQVSDPSLWDTGNNAWTLGIGGYTSGGQSVHMMRDYLTGSNGYGDTGGYAKTGGTDYPGKGVGMTGYVYFLKDHPITNTQLPAEMRPSSDKVIPIGKLYNLSCLAMGSSSMREFCSPEYDSSVSLSWSDSGIGPVEDKDAYFGAPSYRNVYLSSYNSYPNPHQWLWIPYITLKSDGHITVSAKSWSQHMIDKDEIKGQMSIREILHGNTAWMILQDNVFVQLT